LLAFDNTRLNAITAEAQNRYELWRRILRLEKVRRMAEIGVWRGEFAKNLLRHCPFIELYYMVDPWAQQPDWNKPFNVTNEEFEKVYAAAMARTAFASEKIRVLRGTTLDVVGQIRNRSLDYAYIDGDHTLRGITIDLVNLLPKIRLGGIVGGDDFAPAPWQHGPGFEPTLVCPYAIYFAEAHRLPIVILPFNQFMIRNQPALGFSVTDTTGQYADTSLARLAAGIRKPSLLTRLKRLLPKRTPADPAP